MTNEVLASLFGNLATQARDTVQAVFRLIELEARQAANSEQGVCLDACRNSADSLLRTIDDMRSLFTEVPPVRIAQEFDLARCLADTVELLNLSAVSAAGRLQLELPDGPRILLHGDREAVEEVLTRVLAAAVKLSPMGAVGVRFEPGPCAVAIVIRPPEAVVAWRLCQYLNADPDKARFTNDVLLEVNGMVAGNRLRALGGTAQLAAGQEGVEGLRLFLPLPSEEPTGGAASSDEDRQNALDVLLVEDCDDSYELTRVLLPAERVARASDGPEALELVARQRFDVIFMDIHLPGMDGYSVIRALREWETETGYPHTPIVVLSCDDLLTQERYAAEAGCSGYLHKPVREAELSNVLDRLRASRS
jgi:CheY-like chemotaxis protein